MSGEPGISARPGPAETIPRPPQRDERAIAGIARHLFDFRNTIGTKRTITEILDLE
jgi:hypothetical protein